jgi:hypothetical protein
MPIALTQLQSELTALNTAILNVKTNPKPTYSINGKSIQWGEFLKQLEDSRMATLKQIVIAEGPGEVVNEATT